MRLTGTHRVGRRSVRLPTILALVAVITRLALFGIASAATPPPSADFADLVSLFGEHAFCIAAARGVTIPGDPADPAPAAPADHDSDCCTWHGSAAIPVQPPEPDFTPIIFTETAFPAALPAPAPPPAPISGPRLARAPPAGA